MQSYEFSALNLCKSHLSQAKKFQTAMFFWDKISPKKDMSQEIKPVPKNFYFCHSKQDLIIRSQ